MLLHYSPLFPCVVRNYLLCLEIGRWARSCSCHSRHSRHSLHFVFLGLGSLPGSIFFFCPLVDHLDLDCRLTRPFFLPLPPFHIVFAFQAYFASAMA
jgi:hypothetical protein